MARGALTVGALAVGAIARAVSQVVGAFFGIHADTLVCILVVTICISADGFGEQILSFRLRVSREKLKTKKKGTPKKSKRERKTDIQTL